jgi:hypothetical protein
LDKIDDSNISLQRQILLGLSHLPCLNDRRLLSLIREKFKLLENIQYADERSMDLQDETISMFADAINVGFGAICFSSNDAVRLNVMNFSSFCIRTYFKRYVDLFSTHPLISLSIFRILSKVFSFYTLSFSNIGEKNSYLKSLLFYFLKDFLFLVISLLDCLLCSMVYLIFLI